MTSFIDTDINTIGFSHDRIRRTPRVSRYSLAVPDTVNIPPSQLAAYIETNLLHVVCVKQKRKEKKHLRSYNRYQTQSIRKSFPSDRALPKDNTLPKSLLRKYFFAMLGDLSVGSPSN